MHTPPSRFHQQICLPVMLVLALALCLAGSVHAAAETKGKADEKAKPAIPEPRTFVTEHNGRFNDLPHAVPRDCG